MRNAIILLFLLIVPLAAQQAKDQENLRTTEARYPFGKYEIVIKHQKPINQAAQVNSQAKPAWCSAFLEIWKSGDLVDRLDFEDIWPLGWKAGIYLPVKQESPRHFIMMKYGSYDCRTLIFTDEGKLFNLGGGSYRIFQNRYLISPRELPDTYGGEFSIFDMLKNQALTKIGWHDLTKDLIPIPANDTGNTIMFYTNGTELFAGIVQVNIQSWQVINHTKCFYQIHIDTGKLTEAIFDPKIHKEFIIDLSNMDMNHQCECVKNASK